MTDLQQDDLSQRAASAPPVSLRDSEALSCPEHLSADRNLRILAGAREIFEREGYEGASMAGIAAAAAVSKGTLYNYFPSKEALFSAYVSRQCARHVDYVFEFPDLAEGRTIDPAGILKLVGERFLDAATTPEALATHRVVLAAALKFPELAQSFYAAGPGRSIQRLSALLERLNQANLLAIDRPTLAAEQFLALVQTKLTTRHLFRIEPRPTEAETESAIESAVEIFLRFYGRPEPTPRGLSSEIQS